MSEREHLLQLINETPDYRIGYVLAFVEGLNAGDNADDVLCESLYQDYMNDPDKDVDYSLEDCKKEWGLSNV